MINKNLNSRERYLFENRFYKLKNKLEAAGINHETGALKLYKEICNHISRNNSTLYGKYFSELVKALNEKHLVVSVISDKELAEKTGLKNCTIRKYKIRLREAGIIIQIKPKFHTDINVYVLGTNLSKYENLFLEQILDNSIRFDVESVTKMYLVDQYENPDDVVKNVVKQVVACGLSPKLPDYLDLNGHTSNHTFNESGHTTEERKNACETNKSEESRAGNLNINTIKGNVNVNVVNIRDKELISKGNYIYTVLRLINSINKRKNKTNINLVINSDNKLNEKNFISDEMLIEKLNLLENTVSNLKHSILTIRDSVKYSIDRVDVLEMTLRMNNLKMIYS